MNEDQISRIKLLRYLVQRFAAELHHIPTDPYDAGNCVEMSMIVQTILEYKEDGDDGRTE